MTTHGTGRNGRLLRPAMTLMLATLALATAAGDAQAQRGGRNGRNESAIVEMADFAFRDVATDFKSEQAVPQLLLQQAEGILIIPNMIKAGFVIGGKHGRGVLLVRTSKGTWSNPVFVTLSGGSVGLQVGAQSSELLLIFRNKQAVQRVLNGRDKLTLGGNVAVAAGPVGKQLGAGTRPAPPRRDPLLCTQPGPLRGGLPSTARSWPSTGPPTASITPCRGSAPSRSSAAPRSRCPPRPPSSKASSTCTRRRWWPPRRSSRRPSSSRSTTPALAPGTVIEPAACTPAEPASTRTTTTVIESTPASDATTPGASFKPTDPDSTSTPARPKPRSKPKPRSNPDDVALPPLDLPN